MKKNIIKKSIFILISIVAVLIIIIGTSYAFFSASHNSSSDTNVGIAKIQLDKIGTTTYTPSSTVPVETTITNIGTISVLVRIRPIVYTLNGAPIKVDFHSFDNFIFDNVDTFYYTKTLSPKQTTSFSYTFDIVNNMVFDDNNMICVDYFAECVQCVSDAYNDAFASAPQEWMDIVDELSL